MEFKVLLIFVIIVGVAYIILKITEKKIDPWSGTGPVLKIY